MLGRSGFVAALVVALLSAACASTAQIEPSADGGAPATGPQPTVTPDTSGAALPDTDPAADTQAADSQAASGIETSPDPEATDTAELKPRFSTELTSDFVAPPYWAEPLGAEATFVELDNGLRVLMRRNDSPGGQLQLRLVVDAGSVNEEPDALGAAHFLEHMMFNGTERFPGNELYDVLEGFGSGFGPDVNAFTSYDETVYQLTVPTRSQAEIELAFDILAQWASAALIEPAAVVAERGIVREEYRRRFATAGGRIGSRLNQTLHADTVWAGRSPIGTLESIETMDAPELRRFYETWYTPDNMVVVAVGDFSDESVLLTMIEERFGSLEPAPAQPPRPDPTGVVGFAAPDGQAESEGQAEPDGQAPAVLVLSDPELIRSEASVYWRIASSNVENIADVRSLMIRQMALLLLNDRLFEDTERAQEGAIISATTRSQPATDDRTVLLARVGAEPENLGQALDDLLVRVEQMRQYPVSQGEFARIVERARTEIERRFDEQGSVQDRDIAAALVRYGLRGDAYPSAQVDFDMSNEVIDSITRLDLQVFWDQTLAERPVIALTGPNADTDLLAPDEAGAIYSARVGYQVPAPEIDDQEPESLMERPPPVGVIDRQTIPEISTMVVTYANGARLAFRWSNIVENSVDFEAVSRGGHFLESPEIAPMLSRADELVLASGFDSFDKVALERFLSERVATLQAGVGRAEEWLAGSASSEDLETLFQLIHLQMTESTIAPAALRRFEQGWRPIVENPATVPGAAADLVLWRLRYGDSPWFRLMPTKGDLDELDVDAQLNAWRQRFANAADFDFVFVGDADVDTVIDLGASYLGTLPALGTTETSIDRDPGIPEANLVETIKVGVGDQGRVRINWESPYPFTIEAEVEARVLERIVEARLRDLVREQLGASYSPTAAVSVLSEPKPWVDTIIEVNGDPDRLEEISATVRQELARIRSGELATRYLDSAVDLVSEDWIFFSNQDWLSLIYFSLANPSRSPGEYQKRSLIAEAMTLDDVARAANIVFPESRSVEVRMLPAD